MFVVILPVRTPVGLVWVLHCVLCLFHSNTVLIYFVILLAMNFYKISNLYLVYHCKTHLCAFQRIFPP